MAMSFIFAPMLLLLTAFGGTGNELLNFVDSPTYWRMAGIEETPDSLIPLISGEDRPAADQAAFEAHVADLSSPEFVKRQKALAALAKAGSEARPTLEKAQASKDPEVATAATQILSKLGKEISDSRLHRLMAIRSLGELKAPSATPHIEKLTTSTEPFVADYAARALASIRGEAYTPPAPDPLTFQKDLEITHPSITALFHSKMAPLSSDVTLRAMVEQGMSLVGGMGGIAGGGPGMPDTDEILDQLTGQVVEILQKVGNIRIDSVTATVPTDVTPDGGGFIISLRGLYDHKRVLSYLEEESGAELGTTRFAETDWVSLGGEFFLHFASDQLLLIVVGNDVAKYAEAVSARLGGKVKEPAGGPAVDLVKDIPEDASVLFAAEIPAAMAEGDPSLAIFKTLVGSLRPGGGGKTALDVRLQGAEEKPVTELFTQMQMGLAMGKGAIAGMAKADKKLAGIAEMLDSIKVKQEGSSITAEALIPSTGDMPLGMIMGYSFFGLRSMEGPVEVAPPDAVEGFEAPPAVEVAPEPPVVRPE